jgi:hypothetical protein
MDGWMCNWPTLYFREGVETKGGGEEGRDSGGNSGDLDRHGSGL